MRSTVPLLALLLSTACAAVPPPLPLLGALTTADVPVP